MAFAGETVSRVTVRGDRAGAHLDDDSYAQRNAKAGGSLTVFKSGQAVWIPAVVASAITFGEDHEHQGGVARGGGVFHTACAKHGGDMDIHTDALTIERPGRDIAHPLTIWRVLRLLVLVPLASGLRSLNAAVTRKGGLR